MKKIIIISILILFMTVISTNCLAYASSVASGSQVYTNLNLSYPLVYLDDKIAQDKINTDIAKYVYELKGRYDNGEFYNGWMKYKVMYEDDKYLSIILTRYFYWAGAAHGLYTEKGVVYNKYTGDKIPLSYFLPIKSAEEIEYGILDFVTPLYNENMKRIYLNRNKNVKRISEDYFLGGNGTIYLIYQPYELASFADGATRVQFTSQAIDYFKRRYSSY